ncbi:MAG: diacylglycerol kinase family protein [Cyclobacteriaceae bacterium]
MKGFNFTARLKSFRYAFAGLAWLFRTQHNVWIHCAAAVMVVVAGWYFQVTTTEWALLTLVIGGVFIAEAFNTAIEVLTDKVSPERNEQARIVKDVAAGAVLLAAITAAVIGMIVLGPHVWVWL